MAKVHTASHGNPAIDPTWLLIAECMDEVRRDAGLNVDQFADVLGKGSRQVGKWLSATERPQFEAVFAVERFRVLLVTALAKRIGQIEVETVIRIRRTA